MPLSCINCRQRKIKCDRNPACTQCAKAGLQCKYPTRQPRMSGKRKRLEEPGHQDATSPDAECANGNLDHGNEATEAKPIPKPSNSGSAFLDRSDVGSAYSSFVRRQGRTRYINQTFWTQLDQDAADSGGQPADEVSGDNELCGGTTESGKPPALFIFGDHARESADVVTVSDEQGLFLFDVYFTRVHPLCRLLHKPTAMSMFRGVKGLTDTTTNRLKFSSLEAILNALNLISVVSLSNAECKSNFGKDKRALLTSLRQSTESALAACDLPNTRELVTLQAFTLYIVAIHSEQPTQTSWALLGLAVRISQGLGLHLDGDGAAWDSFHAEMRRRLWWQLVALDVLMSTDRASRPLILDGSFTTRKPLNIDDLDIDHQNRNPVADRRQITEMTLALTFIDGLNILRTINSTRASIQTSVNLASVFSEKLEVAFAKSSFGPREIDLDDNYTWLIYMSGQLMSLMMWLAVQYPLHSQVTTPHDFPTSHALRTAVSLLSLKDRIEKQSHVTHLLWWFRMFEPWHALAVALSILAADKNSESAAEVWPVVETAYNRCATRMSDESQGDVWVPLQSLMRKARAARPGSAIESTPLELQSTVPEGSKDIKISAEKTLAERAPGPPFTSLSSSLLGWNMDITLDPHETCADVAWEDWNQFVDDLAYSGPDYTTAMTDAWFM